MPNAPNCGVYALADDPGGGTCPAGEMCCAGVGGPPPPPAPNCSNRGNFCASSVADCQSRGGNPFVSGLCGGSCAPGTIACLTPAACTAPRCGVSISPKPITMDVGDTLTITASVSRPNGYISKDRVTFASNDTSIVTVIPSDPRTDNSEPFQATIQGVATGTTSVRANARVSQNYACYQDSPRNDNCVRTVAVTVGAPGVQCTQPVPRDPPSTTCSPGLGVDGSILWSWDAVAGADEYSFLVEDAGGNPVVGTPTGWVAAATFGPTCALGGECRRLTNLPPGTYRSSIQARGTCTESTIARSAFQTVGICPAGPWWQVTGGGVTTTGSVSSSIPVGCQADPICQDVLIVEDPLSLRPAAAIYTGNYDFSADPGSQGNVSSTDEWLVSSSTRVNIYSYEFFESLADGKSFDTLPGSSIVGTAAIASSPSGTAGNGGYAWIRVTGDATLGFPGGSDEVVINKKVVLFVEGDLTVYDGSRLVNEKLDFFMAIVKGDITIDPALSSPDSQTPALTGIFSSDGTFSTGTTGSGDGILVLKGSVAGTTLRLERDLGGANTNTPAEHFIYSPAAVANYPPSLSEKHLVWREVAP